MECKWKEEKEEEEEEEEEEEAIESGGEKLEVGSYVPVGSDNSVWLVPHVPQDLVEDKVIGT